MKLCTKYVVCPVQADVCLRRGHHAQHGRYEVEPNRRPNVREDGRPCRTRGVDAEPRYRRKQKDIEHDEDADQIAGIHGERRSI